MAMDNFYESLQINTDGGARGNPGPAAIGVYAHVNDNQVFSISKSIGITTNNVAEYQAVISALEEIDKRNLLINKLNFVLDSQLVVRQITGQYKVKQPHLQQLNQQISQKLQSLKDNKQIVSFSFSDVLRDKNKQADKLVNQALDS